MTRYEPETPKPTISITAKDATMVVRAVGQDNRTTIPHGETRQFAVPYLGLLIGYVEERKAGE